MMDSKGMVRRAEDSRFRLFVRITGSSHGPRRIEDSAKNSADVAAVFAGSKAVAAAAVAARRKKNSARSVWDATPPE